MNELWEKDSFINPNIFYLFNKEIIEYDMKRAGLNLIKEFKLMDKNIIHRLEKLEKGACDRRIGIMQRDDNKFAKSLSQAFQTARKLFFELNQIEYTDVLSIKKDAIFMLKECPYEHIGSHIYFREKNQYSSYIHLGKLELYYNPYTLDVKGISDDRLLFHEDYMIKFLKQFFQKMETTDIPTTISFLRRFIDKYKKRELEIGYYREFNNKSKYHTIYGDILDDWNQEADYIDILYNYSEVLMKVIKIPL